MIRLQNRAGKASTGVLALLLVATQSIVLLHTASHDSLAQQASCKTCLVAGNLASACVDHGNPVFPPGTAAAGTADAVYPVCGLSLPKARQRGPPTVA